MVMERSGEVPSGPVLSLLARCRCEISVLSLCDSYSNSFPTLPHCLLGCRPERGRMFDVNLCTYALIACGLTCDDFGAVWICCRGYGITYAEKLN